MNETKVVSSVSLKDVKPGDVIVRDFYGIKINLTVEKIEDGIVYTIGGWTFYQDTGLEYDPELGLTKENNLTCSWIVQIIPS